MLWFLYNSIIRGIGNLVIAFVYLYKYIELGGDRSCNFKPMLLFQ